MMINPVEIGFKSTTDNRAPQYLDVDAPYPVREDWGMLTESSVQTSPVLPLAFWSHTKLRMGRLKQFSKKNKHCEILVSCSDKERNCIQSHGTAGKLMVLHVNSGNCMQAHGTLCKLRELHASSCNALGPLGTLGNLG